MCDEAYDRRINGRIIDATGVLMLPTLWLCIRVSEV
jgi:hypothetical protein